MPVLKMTSNPNGMSRRMDQDDDGVSPFEEFRGRGTLRPRDQAMSGFDRPISSSQPVRSRPRYADDYSPVVPSRRPLEDDTLVEQNRQLMQQVHKLEVRVQELTQLRKNDVEASLEEYAAKAKNEAQASEELIRALHDTIATQEREMQQLREALEAARQAEPAVAMETIPSASGTSDLHSKASEAHDKAHQTMLRQELLALRASVEQLRTERDIFVPTTTLGETQTKTRLTKDMYEDLTGLLFTDVKETDEGYLYNCVQSGRCGTIQFKLLQPNSSNELQYKPMLDPKRDADLVRLLPEYLTNEIEFKRENASMFLWRLMSCLTRDPAK